MILSQAHLVKPRRSPAARIHCLDFLFGALAMLVLTTCSRPVLKAVPLDAAIYRATLYLHHEYDPRVGLLRESPLTAPDKHWLFTDNWLATQALSCVGDSAMATLLRTHLLAYGPFRHGLIEALAGTTIAWPPRTPSQVERQPGIWLEQRDGQPMTDWQGYTDLALYGALVQDQAGHRLESHQLYRTALQKFDGVGFPDNAFDQRYTTYKLALAIYVAHRLHEPIAPPLMHAFLAKQLDTGGFVTLYDEIGHPLGDSNTETTAYALLALASLAEQPNIHGAAGCLDQP